MGTGAVVVGTGAVVVGTGAVVVGTGATVPFVTSVASTGVPAEGTSVVSLQPAFAVLVRIFDDPLRLRLVLAPSVGC